MVNKIQPWRIRDRAVGVDLGVWGCLRWSWGNVDDGKSEPLVGLLMVVIYGGMLRLWQD
jgi:hypothetical protein